MIKRKESKYTTKENQQTTKEQRRNREELQDSQKKKKKMARSTSISMEWLNVFKEKKNPSICCLQEIHLQCKDTPSQSEGMEKDVPCKWKPNKSWDN